MFQKTGRVFVLNPDNHSEKDRDMVQSLLGKFCIISLWLFSSFCVNTLRLDDAFISWNYVIIGAGNGVSPVQHQAITWINTHQLSVGFFQQTSVKFEAMYVYKKKFKKVWMVVSKMLFIWCRPQCVLCHVYFLKSMFLS